MIGKCDICGVENVEVREFDNYDERTKVDSVIKMCNDCAEEDDLSDELTSMDNK